MLATAEDPIGSMNLLSGEAAQASTRPLSALQKGLLLEGQRSFQLQRKQKKSLSGAKRLKLFPRDPAGSGRRF